MGTKRTIILITIFIFLLFTTVFATETKRDIFIPTINIENPNVKDVEIKDIDVKDIKKENDINNRGLKPEEVEKLLENVSEKDKTTKENAKPTTKTTNTTNKNTESEAMLG